MRRNARARGGENRGARSTVPAAGGAHRGRPRRPGGAFGQAGRAARRREAPSTIQKLPRPAAPRARRARRTRAAPETRRMRRRRAPHLGGLRRTPREAAWTTGRRERRAGSHKSVVYHFNETSPIHRVSRPRKNHQARRHRARASSFGAAEHMPLARPGRAPRGRRGPGAPRRRFETRARTPRRAVATPSPPWTGSLWRAHNSLAPRPRAREASRRVELRAARGRYAPSPPRRRSSAASG